jgi:hypothetical protein
MATKNEPSLLYLKKLQDLIESLKSSLDALECEYDRQLKACIENKIERQGNLRLKHTFRSQGVIVVAKFKELFPETYAELKQERAIKLRKEIEYLIEQDLPEIKIKSVKKTIGRIRLDQACTHKITHKYSVVETGEDT